MVKLISLDLDGTLFNKDGKISVRNMAAIKACHQQGIETVVATGRPPRYTFDFLPDELLKDYTVCYNGSRIYYNMKLIKETCIESEIVLEIKKHIKGINMGIESDDIIYTSFDLRKRWPEINMSALESFEQYDQVLKIIILNNEAFDEALFKKTFSDKVNIFITDKGRLVEIVSKATSKCSAIEWICKREGITLAEVAAFGDDSNDYDIIQHVGLGVAMENAIQDIKDVADRITSSNDADGVAHILEEILEQNNE